MQHYKGRIAEILLESYQNATARLIVPAESAPRAGQYLQAHWPDDPMEVVPTSLFPAGNQTPSPAPSSPRAARSGKALSLEKGKGEDQTVTFPIAGPVPANWHPGTELLLRGPLGRGFELPKRARHVALVALDRNPGRLLPLVSGALEQGAQIALFSDSDGGNLRLAVEQQSLKELSGGLKWADYLAADMSIEKLDELETIFSSRIPAALAAEILVAAPMPCGGMAKCGVCTVQTRNGPRLACEDGPVFKLKEVY